MVVREEVIRTEDQLREESGEGSKVSLHPSALRDRIPAGGLREYWYPAVQAKDVPRRKPTMRRILETDVTFFRGKSGDVVAVTNVCPHRGGSMSHGACHFSGTITCPYHGWTFDETGECVAVLGEGPTSRIPGMRTSRIRTYPTRTLKGLVFVWMGEGEPAPIEEDVPEQFFQPDWLVQITERQWDVNWRPAIENLLDAHVYYLHRSSLQIMTLPPKNLIAMTKMGPRRPRPTVVNGRALTYTPGEVEFLDAFINQDLDRRGGEAPVQNVNDSRDEDHVEGGNEGSEQPVFMTHFQDEYPRLGGAKWPKTKASLYFSKVLHWLRPHPTPPPLPNLSQEWHDFHLPTTYQVDMVNSIYSRVTVPIDPVTSRIFYYHSTHPRSPRERIWDRLFWRLYYRWHIVDNFSGQDGAVVTHQCYDQPERLSATDIFPLGIRRLILDNARDFKRAAEPAES